MKKLLITLSTVATVAFMGSAMAGQPAENFTTGGPGVERECVLTFTDPAAIAAGADVTVTKAQLMPVNSNSAKNRRTNIYQYANDVAPGGTCLTNAWGPPS